jgi:hypothetical protein
VAQLRFRERLNFSRLPKDWRVSNVSVDWAGNPLVLIEEGKPPYPTDHNAVDARIKWLATPPKTRHVIFWDGASERTLTFENSARVLTHHIQPVGEGWLLADARGGRADIYDGAGHVLGALDLGDASEDLQTTPGGKMWVSYFDEGVFGSGIGQQGLVCFDASGNVMFGYVDFAKQNGLPGIDDCYAMNVAGENEVWLSYYTDFPLICIRDFALHRSWLEFGCMQKAFGIFEGSVIFPKCYTRIHGEASQLVRRTLSQPSQTEAVQAIDDTGKAIGGLYSAAARGSHFFLVTEEGLYELR